MVESVELTKLAPPKPSIDEEENARIVRWMYIKSFFLAGLTFSLVLIYLFFLQQVIPGYNWDIYRNKCDAIVAHDFTPSCKFLEKGCFPYGTTSP